MRKFFARPHELTQLGYDLAEYAESIFELKGGIKYHNIGAELEEMASRIDDMATEVEELERAEEEEE